MPETFLVVGEAVGDIVIADGVRYETLGGSPLNAAVGLGRLGNEIVLATRVGHDALGEKICQHAKSNGVQLIAEVQGLERTSTATAEIAPDGSATYKINATWDLTFAMIPPQPFVHLHMGSVGATLEPGGQQVVKIVHQQKDAGATISFDPNIRPDIMGNPEDVIERIETLVSLSHLVKASTDDIGWLYPGRSLDDVVKLWLDAGASIVVVTKGPEGALVSTSSQNVAAPSRPVAVQDTIGAGDSFMAGFLVGLKDKGLLGFSGLGLGAVSSADLEDCLHLAQSCAAFTIAQVGSSPPTRRDLANQAVR
jgi:fructokinase